ncbi:phage major capsid protein [Kocuria oceani]|uniref:Phage major capsid protein n=1 Tax=Kocuria oceani TaxID=988827 RepID=A0ABV9THL8_9MICC|nr:phage major capsid protein [Kocuria oceani]
MKTIEQLVTEAKTLVQKHHDGTLTLAEAERMNAVSAELKTARDAKAAAGPTAEEREEGERLLRALSVPGRKSDDGEDRRLTRAVFKSAARDLARKAKGSADAFQAKALTVGQYDAPLTLAAPASLGEAPAGLLEQVPTYVFGDRYYSFLKQTTRDLNAAVVAPGALKPTSTIGLSQVRDELAVVAHVSEPVDEYLLADVPSVAEVVGNELLYGLHSELERQFLHGTGSANGELNGILNQSGVQVINTGARPIDRLRSALTALEVQGYRAGVIALHPLDWEKVETATASGSGELLLPYGPTATVDPITRRLWGARVATSTAVNVGEAIVIDPLTVGLATDGNISLNIGQPGDTFNRNQVVFRNEGRFGVMLKQAAGVVRVTLEGAA